MTFTCWARVGDLQFGPIGLDEFNQLVDSRSVPNDLEFRIDGTELWWHLASILQAASPLSDEDCGCLSDWFVRTRDNIAGPFTVADITFDLLAGRLPREIEIQIRNGPWQPVTALLVLIIEPQDLAMSPPEIPAVKSQTPTTKSQSPAVKPQAPATKPQALAAKPQAPATKSQAPAAKPQTPATKSQAPAAKPQAAATKSQVPDVKPDPPAIVPRVPAVVPQAPVVKPAVSNDQPSVLLPCESTVASAPSSSLSPEETRKAKLETWFAETLPERKLTVAVVPRTPTGTLDDIVAAAMEQISAEAREVAQELSRPWIWGALTAVSLMTMLLFLWPSRGPDELELNAYRRLKAAEEAIRAVRATQPSEEDWKAFAEELTRELAPLKEALSQKKHVKAPIKELLFWAVEYRLPRILQEGRLTPSPAENHFAENLRQAKSHMGASAN